MVRLNGWLELQVAHFLACHSFYIAKFLDLGFRRLLNLESECFNFRTLFAFQNVSLVVISAMAMPSDVMLETYLGVWVDRVLTL